MRRTQAETAWIFSPTKCCLPIPSAPNWVIPEPVETVSGEQRLTKPKNVYCTRDDAAASAARENAPEKRILDWVEPLEEGDEVFLAFLSYSNRTVGDALCRAAERGVKVTFVLDKPSARGDELEACGGEVLLRGHVGSIGFAHIKDHHDQCTFRRAGR